MRQKRYHDTLLQNFIASLGLWVIYQEKYNFKCKTQLKDRSKRLLQ